MPPAQVSPFSSISDIMGLELDMPSVRASGEVWQQCLKSEATASRVSFGERHPYQWRSSKLRAAIGPAIAQACSLPEDRKEQDMQYVPKPAKAPTPYYLKQPAPAISKQLDDEAWKTAVRRRLSEMGALLLEL